MMSSINAALAVAAGDAGAGTSAAAGKDGNGEAFGLAVKTAEEEHGKRPDGKAASHKADAHGVARTGKSVAGGRQDEATKEATREDAVAEETGVTTAGDLLGRLLGMGFQIPAKAPADVAPTAGGGGGDVRREGGDKPEEQLDERIVISTIADLAGSPSAPDDKAGRVALRVTRVETHFEPRIDTPTLVENVRHATSKALDAKTAAIAPTASGDAARPAFEEVLQSLGLGNEGAQSEADPREGGGRNGEGKTANVHGASAADRSEAGGDAKKTASVSTDTAARSSATGPIISTQVAERIIEAFTPTSADSPASSSPSTNGSQFLRMTAGGAALKTLSIQLEPRDLGRLDVSMRLVDGRLTVELAASEPATAKAIAEDRHGLRKILEHAGFALDDAAITVVARDLAPTAAPTSSTSTGSERQGGQSSANPGGGPAGERQAGSGSSGNERQQRREAEEGAEPRGAASQRPATSVYL